MHKVAVIILNWNGAAILQQFLPSVDQYSDIQGVQLYVADNGSNDNSKDIVSNFPKIQWLDLKENHGFAQGYNLAIQQVDAEYIVLLNSDVEVTENWLEPQIAYLDTHPDVAACQPKILSWKEKNKFEYAGACGGFIDKLGYPLCRGRIMDYLEEDLGQYNTVIPIFWASGAALFIRRSCYLEVGGLDARFFAHMEEIDLCWRLSSRGYKIVVIPDSVVYHVGGATLSNLNPQKTYLNFRNNLLMIYKNADSKLLRKLERKRFLLDYMAILFYVLKGEIKHMKAVLKARSDYKKMKPTFESDRVFNLSKITHKPQGIIDKSVIFQYFIKRKRSFSQL